MMYEQGFQGDVLYMMLYAVVTAIAMMAGCYLLFRRANAIAPDITPPVRLRKWGAAFFFALALCHLWYLPMYFLSSSDDLMLGYLIAGLLDCMTVIPLSIALLLVMLQDRRRPLWPICVMMIPLVVGLVWSFASRHDGLQLMVFFYFLLMWLGLIIYMVRALRQYRDWLRDNYADLEHKEVWQGFVVLVIILLLFAIYSFDLGGPVYEYAMESINIILVFYLLWRVETLSDLSISESESLSADETMTEDAEDDATSMTIQYKITPLLQKYCIDTQLYLQHDLTRIQLAKAIGTNRSYLSLYFSSQGMTYNAYINGLRIQHFIHLYHEAVATHQPISVQQLAHQSGFRSYSTFYTAFKQSMGMTATKWMRPSES